MAQTAVEWLHEIAKQREPDKFDWEQANEMFQEQIENANIAGMEFIPVDPIMYKQDAEDYLPTQRKERAEYSDGTKIPMDSKPIIFPVKIIGPMNNTPNRGLKTDQMANSLMMRGLKKGNVKNGFYYINDGEDEGSISAVVPNKDWLQY